MRFAGKFSPEWGYLAPAPSFIRTVRIVVVAAAVGATAGAGVVFSLMDRPGAEESSVAARTLTQPVDVGATPAATPQVALTQAPQMRAGEHAGCRDPRSVDNAFAARPRGNARGQRIGHQFDRATAGWNCSIGGGPRGDRCRSGSSSGCDSG